MNDIKKRLSVIYGVILAAWILILILAIDFSHYAFYGYVGISGGILASIVAAGSILLWKQDYNPDTTESNAVTLVVTIGYFILSLGANTVFCFLAYLDRPRILPISVNASLLIIFVAFRGFSSPHKNRVIQTAAHTANRTHHVSTLSSMLGELVGMAQEESVKSRLTRLKEQLDYSSNISQNMTEELEAQFQSQLTVIGEALTQNAPAERILTEIDAAEKTWKKRNGVSSMC